ncbi:MAG: DNA-3-methyladenine glycosylase [Deltaproteobacteria bacterium]|nr:DNA-3-methyladenine glycosylase [Deltaproteobacteria bacterium]
MNVTKRKGCGRILLHPFFARDTVKVARDLIGREICREVKTRAGPVLLRARIVETEAYLEKDDAAAHCSRGPTPRAKVMFGKAGVIYVYYIYGNYFMLNFVTEKTGLAGAVLIRAVEPLEGIPAMERNRKMKVGKNLTNGPAKLVLALGIDGSLNGRTLGLPHLAVYEGKPVKQKDLVTTTRIGISVAQELPLRFYEKGNPYVSKK